MNLYLHGLEPQIKGGDSIYEAPDGRRFDVVLTNPPFGTKGANDVPAHWLGLWGLLLGLEGVR